MFSEAMTAYLKWIGQAGVTVCFDKIIQLTALFSITLEYILVLVHYCKEYSYLTIKIEIHLGAINLCLYRRLCN